MPGPAAILRELHRLHRHAEDLRTQINRGPQTIKAHQDKTAKQVELLQQAQESIKKLKITLNEKLKSIHQVEASLPEDVKALYDRLVAAKGDSAMASVQDRTCSACYTEITAQSQNDLLQERLVFCKNCGRILYLPEGM